MNTPADNPNAASWPPELWQLGASSAEYAHRLLALVDAAQNTRLRCRWMPYWTSEVYGFGPVLREYGFYPATLPLCVDTDHAPQLFYRPLQSELETTSSAILVHNRAAREQWKGKNKFCYVMSSPFVLYRRRRSIEQTSTAKGLLFFPAHSTPEVEERTAMDQYIQLLSTAPKDMGPVAVCLYWADVVKERHLPFLNAGIPVLTAGHPLDSRFMERFYEIVRHFRYTASNELGSYAFYSIEMGLPFSLCGPSPAFWNDGDQNVPIGLLEEPPQFQLVKEMFFGWNHDITIEQKQFTLSLLGQDAIPSRAKISYSLYNALFKTFYSQIKRKIIRSKAQFK